MSNRRSRLFFNVLLIILLVVANSLPAVAQPLAQTATTYAGEFFVVAGGDSPVFFVHTDGGPIIQLRVDEKLLAAAGGAWTLNRQRVKLVAQPLGPSRQSPSNQVVDVAGLQADKPAGSPPLPQAAPVTGTRPFVNILCKFPDVTVSPLPPASYFSALMSSQFPGMSHYFQEASYNTVNLNGTIVKGWYTLPKPRSEYIKGYLDWGLAAQDCTSLVDSSVNFNNFQGINLLFNYDLDGYAWGGSWALTLSGTNKTWPMTWMPPWGYNNQTVMAHEMGHAFGMPHSGDSTGTTYKNVWDVMSDTWTDCYLAQNATYGCLGQQEISYHKDIPGWIPAARRFLAPAGSSTITLERLAQPGAGGYLMAKIPINGSSTQFYTVEARKRVGYDQKLVTDGVIIHNVDTTRTNPAWVMNPNGGSTNNAYFLPDQNFADPLNCINIRVASATASGYVVNISTPVAGSPDGPLNCVLKNAQWGDTVFLVPPGGSTVTTNKTTNVPSGVTVKGGCSADGPAFVLDGSSAPPGTNGLNLGTGVKLSGLKITGFPGKQIVAKSGGSNFSCVVAFK